MKPLQKGVGAILSALDTVIKVGFALFGEEAFPDPIERFSENNLTFKYPHRVSFCLHVVLCRPMD